MAFIVVILIVVVLVLFLKEMNSSKQTLTSINSGNTIKKRSSPIDAVPETFVVFDVETTGLDPMDNEIIEIAAIKAHTNNPEQQTYSALVKPSKPIPQKIIELTGITNEMVEAGGIPLDNALEEFREFIGKEKLVAYNKDFDKSFINCAAEKLGKKPIVKHVTCAYKKARAAWPGLKSYKLADLAKMGNLSDDGTHRALADCKRTMIVYITSAQKVKNTFRGTKKILAGLMLILALNGCAMHYENVHPEWNPPKGWEEADSKCHAAADLDVRYGEWGLPYTRRVSYTSCMAVYGYKPKRENKFILSHPDLPSS